MKRQILKCLDIPAYAFGIMGTRGFGKSSIVKQCIREKNMKYIDIRLSTITEDDLGGIPRVDKNNKYYEYKAPKWAYDIVSNNKQRYCILLDEYNQASGEVLNALFDLVLGDVMPDGTVQRRIANIILPTHTSVCLLGNTEEDNPYLSEIPKALMDRVLWIPFNANLQDYKKYLCEKFGALGNKFFEEFKDVTTEINPRNVERMLDIMKYDLIVENHMQFIMNNFIDKNHSELVSRLYNFMINENEINTESELNRKIKDIITESELKRKDNKTNFNWR